MHWFEEPSKEATPEKIMSNVKLPASLEQSTNPNNLGSPVPGEMYDNARVTTPTSPPYHPQNQPPLNGDGAAPVVIELKSLKSQPGSGPMSPGGHQPQREFARNPSSSFQLRALIGKTISYQKRQVFVNICCVALCPLMMVLIAVVLAMVLTNLIENSLVVTETLYCSSVASLDSKSLPILNRDNLTVTTENGVNTTNANYFTPPAAAQNGPVAPVSTIGSCVTWFENLYPFSDPYERNFTGPTTRPLSIRDTLFRPEPPNGYLDPSFTYASTVGTNQLYPWFFYSDGGDATIGTKPANPIVSLQSFILQNVPSEAAETNKTGLLAKFPTRFFFDTNGFTPLPFLVKPDDGDTIDDALATKIRLIISNLRDLNKTVLSDPNASDADKQAFYESIGQITKDAPFGAYQLDKIDLVNGVFQYTIQAGSDTRISRSSNFPTEGYRRLMQQSFLANAIGKSSPNPLTISHGLRVMPSVYSTAFDSRSLFSILGSILFPFGVSFLLPVFVITIVKEKEERILVMMQMSGLKTWAYYLVHFIHFYSMHVLATAVFLISGFVGQLSLMTATQLGLLVLLFLIWGFAQIAVALFLSNFFSKARNALIIVNLIVIAGVIVSTAVERVVSGDKFPAILYLWPPFALYHAMSKMSSAAVSSTEPPYSFARLTRGDEVLQAISLLIVMTIIYVLLAFYFKNVLPSQYGVTKPFYYPISWLCSCCSEPKPRASLENLAKIDNSEIAMEDSDVAAERGRVLNDQYNPECPLIIKNMRKIYAGGKIAVKTVSLAVEPNMVFGLLGPNGAGKTTLISILTGLYKPTAGVGLLAGYDISTQMDDVFRNMGVCPQHDILWDDLTVGEHLYFYARIKGISMRDERAAVEQSLNAVSLAPFEHRLSKGLSGGEKRRLSIAIALIGGPKVVFLDEPTTGLDPEVRRIIWDIVNTAKRGKTIILTTHSMEEAEALCSKIGIMAKGTLRCLGTQLHLKQKYGSGFKFMFTAETDKIQSAMEEVVKLLPPNAKLVDSFSTNVSFEFEAAPGVIPKLFEQIEQVKNKIGIEDWGLSQTTLEEVFLRIVQDQDAEAY